MFCLLKSYTHKILICQEFWNIQIHSPMLPCVQRFIVITIIFSNRFGMTMIENVLNQNYSCQNEHLIMSSDVLDTFRRNVVLDKYSISLEGVEYLRAHDRSAIRCSFRYDLWQNSPNNTKWKMTFSEEK